MGESQAPERWRRPATYLWAALIARISAIAPALLYLLHLTAMDGGQMPGAALTEPTSVKPILVHLGLPSEPPRVASARDPPLDELDQMPAFEPGNSEFKRVIESIEEVSLDESSRVEAGCRLCKGEGVERGAHSALCRAIVR